MGYTNSSLVSYTKLSPNHSGQRTHAIDTITIHCVVGQLSAAGICGCFTSTSVQASCNYGVGKDGDIGLCVEEKNRSWCTSSNANDQRAITIETACDLTHPYAVTDKAYNALIKLCADICRRNGIKKLVWSTDKNTRMNHANGCNMTVHRDYANKACPGDFLYNRMGDIAAKVNAQLGASGGSTVGGSTGTSSDIKYKVRKTWADANSQIGAFSELANAKKMVDSHPGYKAFDLNGNQIYPAVASAPAQSGEMYRVRKSWADEKSQVGAYTILDNAKRECDKHPGYSVFNSKGQAVYSKAAAASSSDIIYIVKSGDTLSGIAAKYGTTYQVLAQYNGIANPNIINVGQQIKIPTSAAKAASAAPKKTAKEIAQEIIKGTCSDSRWSSWGNGDTRKQRVAAAGYNYTEVQNWVNQLI